MLTINPFIEQQTLHINPTNEERKLTDIPFITVFYLIICCWLIIIITVFSNSPTTETFLGKSYSIEVIHDIYPRLTWKFLLGLILSGLVSFTYINVLSQDGAKYIVPFGIFILYCLIFIIIIGMILATRAILNDWILINLPITLKLISSVLLISYLVESLLCTFHVGTEPIFKIIRDACRALLCCPISMSLFIFLMSIITILTLVFSIYITLLVFFTKINESSSYFLPFLNLYCTIVIMRFLMNFTKIVISGYVMDWFWSKDPNVNYKITIKRNLGRILNYHIGSVAFFSIPPLPTLWSLYQFCRCQDDGNVIVKRNNIFTRFVGQLCAFINISDFGMIQTSIYGYESGTAIKAAHDLVSKNNHEFYLAVCAISNIAIGCGLFLIAIPFAFEKISFCFYGFAIPFYTVFSIAVQTLLVNKMIINHTSEAFKQEYNSVNPTAVV